MGFTDRARGGLANHAAKYKKGREMDVNKA